MSLSNKALAFSIQSLLSGYDSHHHHQPRRPSPITSPLPREYGRHPSCSTESTGSVSPDTLRDHPKTPGGEDISKSQQGTGSPDDSAAGDQNGKKPRTIFSRDQVQKLEEAYLSKRYLTRRERKDLATAAQLSHTQVKIWFQNRRAKAKLKDRKAIALMHSAITSQRQFLRLPSCLPPLVSPHHLLPPIRPRDHQGHSIVAPIPTRLPALPRPEAMRISSNWYGV